MHDKIIGTEAHLKLQGHPGGSDGKESACNAGDLGSIPGSGREKGMAPTPVFLPRESQGWRSPVGCCLRGRTELDTTEAT